MPAQDAEAGLEGIGSLIRVTGLNIPARARFVAESMVGATVSSLTLGLVCGQAGAMCASVGPLVPFLVGSWLGYSVGLLAHWKMCKANLKMYAEKYPSLLMYSLEHQWNIVLPEKMAHAELPGWVFAGDLGRLTMSIIAAQSCRDSIEEIEQRGREKVAEQYHSRNDDN